MSLRLNSEVRLQGLQPQTLLAIQVIYALWVKSYSEEDMTITSVVDGDHSGGPLETSSHYSGSAIDIDLEPLQPVFQKQFSDDCAARLTRDFHLHYYVADENEKAHLHIAYIPRRPASL